MVEYIKLLHTAMQWQQQNITQIYNSQETPYISLSRRAGGRLNKKDGLTRYGDSHVKDKTS